MFETILVSGLALGVAQLAAGFAVGLWMGRRRSDRTSDDLARAYRIASDVDSITTRVGHSLQDHADRMKQLDQRLHHEFEVAQPSRGPVTDLVVGVVSELLSANKKLASDLEHSRAELAEQLDELNEHREQALTDSLTGLPNRRAFDDRLRDSLDGWRKRQSAFTLMMIDVDHFKQFNDRYGHQTGDAALQAVAEALRAALRNHDLVARYGGEEFAVILPYTTLENAGPAVQKVLEAVEGTEIATSEGVVDATVSIGVASVLPQERGEALVDRADSALYAAKENGRKQAWQHDGVGLRPLDSEQLPLDPQSAELQLACSELSASLAEFMEADEVRIPELPESVRE